jgi:hypothetical protein
MSERDAALLRLSVQVARHLRDSFVPDPLDRTDRSPDWRARASGPDDDAFAETRQAFVIT